MATCNHCKADLHPSYAERYSGYCLDCANAGVPDLLDTIAELQGDYQTGTVHGAVLGFLAGLVFAAMAFKTVLG